MEACLPNGSGHVFEIETISTLVLDLGVTTEMSEDDFFDGGNFLAWRLSLLLMPEVLFILLLFLPIKLLLSLQVGAKKSSC